MKEWILKTVEDNSQGLLKLGVTLLILVITYVSLRVFKRYIATTASKHRLAEQRTASISKVGQGLILVLSAAFISNVLGFGIQGIFVATSSFFALVGIAFFANWSILSNITASVLLYFTFPYRIGQRLSIDLEPNYNGILKDVTLLYFKIQTDGGSLITVPANIAIQKIITIQSEADHQAALKAAEEEKASNKSA